MERQAGVYTPTVQDAIAAIRYYDGLIKTLLQTERDLSAPSLQYDFESGTCRKVWQEPSPEWIHTAKHYGELAKPLIEARREWQAYLDDCRRSLPTTKPEVK